MKGLYEFIGFGNYWDPASDKAKQIFEALEAGKHVEPSCSCIGYTRAQYEESKCYADLTAKYGERLAVRGDRESIYYLKEVANAG